MGGTEPAPGGPCCRSALQPSDGLRDARSQQEVCVCVCVRSSADGCVYSLLIRKGWECEGSEELCLQSGIKNQSPAPAPPSLSSPKAAGESDPGPIKAALVFNLGPGINERAWPLVLAGSHMEESARAPVMSSRLKRVWKSSSDSGVTWWL